jgi:hypothetical protein
VLSNSFIGAFNGGNVLIGAGAPAQGTQVLNCTLAGVSEDHVGVGLMNVTDSVVLGNLLSAEPGAPRTTGISLGDATACAAVHLNDVRAMATGIVCGHGSGNNVSDNPGAANC